MLAASETQSAQCLIIHDASYSNLDCTRKSVCSLVRHILLSYQHVLSDLRGTGVSLAILDAGLDNLRLPLVRPPSPTFLVKVEGDDPAQMKREFVPFLAERFFQWVGKVDASA